MKIGNTQVITPQTERFAGNPGLYENTRSDEHQNMGMLLEDMAEISENAKSDAIDMQTKLDEIRKRHQELRDGLKRAQDLGEGMSKAWKEKILCLKIAMRIMSGDKVPLEDRRFLMEKDPELYRQAISLRHEKKDQKEYERLSENEKNDNNERKSYFERGSIAKTINKSISPDIEAIAALANVGK